MDTTYYTFQTRKIKVSGGADLVTFVPAVQPAPQTRERAHAGEVLDFDLCRRRLETRTAWKDLTAAAQAAEESMEEESAQVRYEAAPRRPSPARRGCRRAYAPWMEICASALALGLVCLVGAAALLSLV